MTVGKKTDIVIERVGEPLPNPFNTRRITDAEIESLTRSIREFGLIDPIIARREDSTVIGGHLRLSGREVVTEGS